MSDRRLEPSQPAGSVGGGGGRGKFSAEAFFYQARLLSVGKPRIYSPGETDETPRRFDPLTIYPEDLLPVRRQLRVKLESLLPGEDGALALEALAVACPEWGTIEKYLGIATDRQQPAVRRVVAANLLVWQPSFLEMEGGGVAYGKNAPPETASKLLPLLEIREALPDWRQQDAVTGVFRELLGTPHGDLSDEQRAARKELLPKLRAMRNGPYADAALSVLREVYGFSRAEIAWDANIADRAEQPRPSEETGAGAYAGPPAEVTAQRSFPFPIRLVTLAEKGETLLVGDGHIGGRSSESRVLLLNPQDFSEKAKTSITEDLPWSSSTAVLGRDQRHVLVFNRVLELPTLKTVGVLDVKKAVTKGNVCPHPLAVSSDGKSALVHVSSYLGSGLDALALFDLASGKLQRTVDVAEEQPVQNACFLADHILATHGWRGCVLAVDLANGKQRVLCDNGPRIINTPGINWHMAFLAKDRHLVVSGYEEFVVIETDTGKQVFRRTVERGNALPILGGRFLLYQARRRQQESPLLFFCVRVPDGQVVATFGRDESYETLMAGEQDDVIYAVRHDTLSRLRFRWGGVTQTAKPNAKAHSVHDD